jgi:hypothetical protein
LELTCRDVTKCGYSRSFGNFITIFYHSHKIIPFSIYFLSWLSIGASLLCTLNWYIFIYITFKTRSSLLVEVTSFCVTFSVPIWDSVLFYSALIRERVADRQTPVHTKKKVDIVNKNALSSFLDSTKPCCLQTRELIKQELQVERKAMSSLANWLFFLLISKANTFTMFTNLVFRLPLLILRSSYISNIFFCDKACITEHFYLENNILKLINSVFNRSSRNGHLGLEYKRKILLSNHYESAGCSIFFSCLTLCIMIHIEHSQKKIVSEYKWVTVIYLYQ